MNKILLAAILAGGLGTAKADDLTVTMNGLQTYYEGTLFHLETNGMAGEVILDSTAAPSISEDDDQGPAETGIWHVIVRPQKGPAKELMLNCAGTSAYTSDHGARVSLKIGRAHV